MSARASLGFLTVGAILAFAVRAQPDVIDLQVTGLILILVGLVRPLVAGWSSLAPRRTNGEDAGVTMPGVEVETLVDVEGAAGTEPPAAGRPGSRRSAAVRTAAPARHPVRSTTTG